MYIPLVLSRAAAWLLVIVVPDIISFYPLVYFGGINGLGTHFFSTMAGGRATIFRIREGNRRTPLVGLTSPSAYCPLAVGYLCHTPLVLRKEIGKIREAAREAALQGST